MWNLPKSSRKSRWRCLRKVLIVLILSQLCPHSWALLDSWEFSLWHTEKNIMWIEEGILPPTTDLHLLFPAPCLGPSIIQSSVITPGFYQAANSPYARAGLCCLRWNVFQIFLTVKLNQRLCFSWYVCICWGNFTVVIFILLSMEGL